MIIIHYRDRLGLFMNNKIVAPLNSNFYRMIA